MRISVLVLLALGIEFFCLGFVQAQNDQSPSPPTAQASSVRGREPARMIHFPVKPHAATKELALIQEINAYVNYYLAQNCYSKVQ